MALVAVEEGCNVVIDADHALHETDGRLAHDTDGAGHLTVGVDVDKARTGNVLAVELDAGKVVRVGCSQAHRALAAPTP